MAGGSTLRVQPVDPDRLAEVARLLEAVTGSTSQQERHTSVSVPVAGDAVLAVVVPRLAAAGIAVSELSLHLPSLDEVFFTLTGRPRTDEGAAA